VLLVINKDKISLGSPVTFISLDPLDYLSKLKPKYI